MPRLDAIDALIDETHDALRAELGLESAAALAAILGAIRRARPSNDAVAAIARPLLECVDDDASIAERLAARILSTDARRASGLYTTPLAITRLAFELLGLAQDARVLDPACGAGAFLHPFAAAGHEVHGRDRNPHMIELARVVLGARAALEVGDSLAEGDFAERFDAVVLNPPFGVHVDASVARGFSSASPNGKTPSEVLFLELAAKALRAGGRLAAIVPAGFFTNHGLAHARRVLQTELRLVLAVELPPEAFMHAGARMSSFLLCAERVGETPRFGRVGEFLRLEAKDAGHDRLGNALPASDLDRVLDEARAFLRDAPGMRVTPGREMEEAFATRAPLASGSDERLDARCSVVRLGKTPPKDAYAEQGHFIVKVGNLTGHGLDFTPRDRNFVTPEYAQAVMTSRVGEELTLRRGDLLVTASAHARRYIAEKVDRVEGFPDWIEEPVFFVGELLLLRPRDEATSLALLGYLRSPAGKHALRALVRGQTAHLLPKDVRSLCVPTPPRSPEADELHARLLREAELALELERERRALDALARKLYGGPFDD